MISNLFVIIGIVLWGYVLTGILKSKKCFGPVLSIAAGMAVLEIGGVFGVLWPTAYIYCIAVGICFVFYIVKTRDKADIKIYFLNPSVIGFAFASIFYMILTSDKSLLFRDWDTFMHWGMFSKAVFFNHNLDFWSDLNVNHQVYPHGMASWYSLFALGKNAYSERDVMLSINVLLFASSTPIIDIAVSKVMELFPRIKKIAWIIFPISGMSVAGFLWIWKFSEIQSFASGYMDIPLGAAFMVSLCAVVESSEDYYRKAILVSLLSAMLVMIKPSGIIFVGTVWLVYLINEFVGGKKGSKRDYRKLFCGGMILLSIPLLELGIWDAMMKYLNMTGGDQFSLKAFLLGTVLERYQSDSRYAEIVPVVIRNFFVTFFTGREIAHMSAAIWMVLCIVIAAFIIVGQKDENGKKRVLLVNLCLLLCFFLYNLFLLWTYLTTMSEGEALGTKCYDRYIGSYIIGWFSMEIYSLLFHGAGTAKVQGVYLGGIFLCSILGFLNKNTYYQEIAPEIVETHAMSEEIKKSIFEDSDRASTDAPDLWVSYANREEELEDRQIIQLGYYLFPEVDFISIYGIQENYHREMKDIIAEFSFDYVVLYGVNEEFYNDYYWFFSDGLSNTVEKYENKAIRCIK